MVTIQLNPKNSVLLRSFRMTSIFSRYGNNDDWFRETKICDARVEDVYATIKEMKRLNVNPPTVHCLGRCNIQSLVNSDQYRGIARQNSSYKTPIRCTKKHCRQS